MQQEDRHQLSGVAGQDSTATTSGPWNRASGSRLTRLGCLHCNLAGWRMFAAMASYQHHHRIFKQCLELAQKFRARRTVHHPMVR